MFRRSHAHEHILQGIHGACASPVMPGPDATAQQCQARPKKSRLANRLPELETSPEVTDAKEGRSGIRAGKRVPNLLHAAAQSLFRRRYEDKFP